MNLEHLLAEAVKTHEVPGASVAVLRDGRIETAAAGVANTRTGETVTTEHLFSFGSVTKILTATATTRQVTQGVVDLEAPVSRYFKDFAPVDARARDITVRQLLSHCSGLVGTIFQDTGAGPEALAAQVKLIADQPLFHRPGALTSYCNSAMLMLGRLLEIATGKPWSQALVDVLTGPLGLETVVTQPEQALRWRHVVGHLPTPDGGWAVEPMPFWMPVHGPAGSTPMGRARDLLTLVNMHLRGGRAPDGTAFLAPSLVAAMQECQMPSAQPFLFRGFGLGWMILEFGGRRIIGHDGATMGSTAYLRVDPERRFAVALLVNATVSLPLYETVVGALFRDAVGAWETPPAPAGPVSRESVARYLGRYADSFFDWTLDWRDGRVVLISGAAAGGIFGKAEPRVIALEVAGPGQFVASGPDAAFHLPERHARLTLSRPWAVVEADGQQYLQTHGISFRRVDT